MIQPISSNVNFAGNISVDKKNLRDNIGVLPKSMQGKAEVSIEDLKNTLEVITPDTFNGRIHTEFVNGAGRKLKNASLKITLFENIGNGKEVTFTEAGGNIIDKKGNLNIGAHCKVIAQAVRQYFEAK